MGYHVQLGKVTRFTFVADEKGHETENPGVGLLQDGFYEFVPMGKPCGLTAHKSDGTKQLDIALDPGCYLVVTGANRYILFRAADAAEEALDAIIVSYDKSKDKWSVVTNTIKYSDITDLKTRMTAAEKSINSHAERLTNLETTTANLNARVTALENAGK